MRFSEVRPMENQFECSIKTALLYSPYFRNSQQTQWLQYMGKVGKIHRQKSKPLVHFDGPFNLRVSSAGSFPCDTFHNKKITFMERYVDLLQLECKLRTLQ